MSFLTGTMFIHAPASALNNAGKDPDTTYENAVATKMVTIPKEGSFPYVSAQAIRYWLRSTLEREKPLGWSSAPTFREEEIAYTDANPIFYWDDDLFGYMRAPGSSPAARNSRANMSGMTELEKKKGKDGKEKEVNLTRVSPFRLSTFMAISRFEPTRDFGVMTRFDGDKGPVIHNHQFYSSTLKGLFSLDLHAVGTFSDIERTGFKNLDSVRIALAKERNLSYLDEEKSYRLSYEERRTRVAALLEGMSIISGGAKQALHYTDVTPVIVLTMVTKGGNNPLQFTIDYSKKEGRMVVNLKALRQMIEAWGDQIESPLYIGWVEGFQDEERERLKKALDGTSESDSDKLPTLPHNYQIGHPRKILQAVAQDFQKEANHNWLV